jgi:hypothetical protein
VRRRARRGVVWSGAGVAAALVITCVTLGFLVARGVNLNQFKPFEMLLWEVRNGGEGLASAAAEELWRRRASVSDAMSDERADRVLAAALRIHADHDRSWPGMLTGFIDEAMVTGRMTPPQVQRYFENIASPRLLLPAGPPPRAGTPLQLDLDPGWRAGPFSPGRMHSIGLLVSLIIDEPASLAGYRAFRGRIGLPQPEPPWAGVIELEVPEDAQSVTVAATLRYEPMLSHLAADYPAIQKLEEAELPVVERRVQLDVPVGPPPVIDIVLDTSDATRAALLEAIRPSLTRREDSLTIVFERRMLPVAVSARIFVRDPATGQEWEAPPPLVAQEEMGLYGIGLNVAGLTAETVDLILVPAPELLRERLRKKRMDATATMFGAELVIPGVPVKPYVAPARREGAPEGDAARRRLRPNR